jgi:hypothetical protein
MGEVTSLSHVVIVVEHAVLVLDAAQVGQGETTVAKTTHEMIKGKCAGDQQILIIGPIILSKMKGENETWSMRIMVAPCAALI